MCWQMHLTGVGLAPIGKGCDTTQNSDLLVCCACSFSCALRYGIVGSWLSFMMHVVPVFMPVMHMYAKRQINKLELLPSVRSQHLCLSQHNEHRVGKCSVCWDCTDVTDS